MVQLMHKLKYERKYKSEKGKNMILATVYLKKVKWFDGAADAEHPENDTRELEIAENEDHTVNVEALLFDIEEMLRDNIDEWTVTSYNAEIETSDGTRIPLRDEDGHMARIDIDRIAGDKKYSILNWDDNRISFETNRTDYTCSEACEALKEIALKNLMEYEYANNEEEAKDLYKALLNGKEEMASVGITEDCCSFTAYYENRYEIVETPLQP